MGRSYTMGRSTMSPCETMHGQDTGRYHDAAHSHQFPYPHAACAVRPTLSIMSKAIALVEPPDSARTLVMAAVRVVFP